MHTLFVLKQTRTMNGICFTRDNARVDHLRVSSSVEVTKLIARFLISLALLPPASGKQMRKPTCYGLKLISSSY